MKKIIKYAICTVVCASLLFAMFGCGKSGGGSSSSSSAPAYSGSSSVSGTATASGADAASVSGGASSSSLSSAATIMNLQETMSSKKWAALTSVSSAPSVGSGFSGTNAGGSVINTVAGGTAYLYAIAPDGSLIDTGFRATLDNNGAYTFPGIKAGEAYVVRIIKEGTDTNGQSNVLKMESMFRLDAGEPTENCDVDVVEKMVMGFVLDEIIKYAETTNINKRKLRKLQDAIYDAVIEMAQQGLISVPSAVMTKEEYQATTALLTDAFKAVLNQLKTSKKVKRASKEAQTGAKVSKLSSLSDQELKTFFADIMGFGGNDSPPDSFMKKFVDQFRLNTTTSLKTMVDGIYGALIEDAKITANVATETEVKTYLYSEAIAAHNELMEGLVSLNAFEANGGITTNMSLFFPSFVSSNATEDDMIEASEFVPLFQAAFPNPVTGNVSANQILLTVPQALGYFGIMMPMDAEEDEDFDSTILGGMYNHFGVNYPYVDDEEMGGMIFNPIYMLVSFGWITGSESFIDSVEFQVNSMHVPETMIVTDNNGKAIAITADATVQSSDNGIMWKPVETLGLWFGYQSQNSIDEVRLTYPTSVGPKTVTFAAQSQGGSYGAQVNCWNIFEQWKQGAADSTLDKIIVDFSEGTATLTLWNNGTQLTDVDGDGDVDSDDIISATIMKPNMGSPTMVYPSGPDPVKVALYGWDNEFEPEEMATNESNVARPVFEWQDPPGAATFLAANPDLSLAYTIDVGMNINKIDWSQPWNPSSNFKVDNNRPITPADEHGWRNIWNSWDDDTWIYGNSFTCPVDLQPTTKNSAQNYETRYNVNIRPILIDNASRRTVWEGSGIWTEFYVGSVDWTVALRGTIVFPEKEVLDRMLYNFRPAGLQTAIPTENGSWKMGLFHMSGVESGGWNWQDFFWDQSNKTARLATGNGVYAIPSASILDGSISYLPFLIPAITKTDAILKKNNEYSMVLWYDIDNDDSISVNQSVTSWAEFTEPTFRLDMGINMNNSNLHYWANLDGNHRDGDLTLAENQLFNYNFADKLREWGWLNFMDNNYDPGVSDDWEDNNSQFTHTDLGDPELEFVKDPMVGKSQLRGWWNGSGLNPATSNVSAVDYLALVRDWDQMIVATFDLTDTGIITENAGNYFVSINAIEATIPGNVTQDSYQIWGMVDVSGNQDVATWNSTSAWVDAWFRSEDSSVTYTPDDVVWGFVKQDGLIYVGVRKGSGIAGSDLTFAMAYNDGSNHILARCSRINSYSLQQDSAVSQNSMYSGIDWQTYDIFVFGDKNKYPNGDGYSYVNDLSSNGAWGTFISFVKDNPYTPINVYAFQSTVVNDSAIVNADASGGRFDIVDMSYVQSVSQGKLFGRVSILYSPLAIIASANNAPEILFDSFIDNTINSSVTTLTIHLKSDDSMVEKFPATGTIQTSYYDQFSEGNWEIYGMNDAQASINPGIVDFTNLMVSINYQPGSFYLKGVAGDKTYVGEINYGEVEYEMAAWAVTGSMVRVMYIDDTTDSYDMPNYFGIANANDGEEIISDVLAMAVATGDADAVSSANIGNYKVYVFDYNNSTIDADPYFDVDRTTLSDYDMIGAFYIVPTINASPIAYGVSSNIQNTPEENL